jgi:putative CRISPR-associated protein (TIGR02619 family)
MKVLYVTVGTSAITNAGIGKAPDGRNNATLQGNMRLYSEDRRKDFGRWGKLFDDLVEAHRRYWELSDDFVSRRYNFSQSSAELTSTYCLFRDRGPAFSVDRLVLLPTDTIDGQMASRIVLAVMKSPHYPVRVEKDQIVEEPIPGLESDMKKLAGGLETAIRKHSASDRDELLVNVTGGLKGTSLMLGRLSARLNFDVYYQHETSDAPVYMKELWQR